MCGCREGCETAFHSLRCKGRDCGQLFAWLHFGLPIRMMSPRTACPAAMRVGYVAGAVPIKEPEDTFRQGPRQTAWPNHALMAWRHRHVVLVLAKPCCGSRIVCCVSAAPKGGKTGRTPRRPSRARASSGRVPPVIAGHAGALILWLVSDGNDGRPRPGKQDDHGSGDVPSSASPTPPTAGCSDPGHCSTIASAG